MEKLYEFFENDNTHWNRRDDSTIIVFTSGYRTKECYDIEKECMKAGMFCMSMRFDSMSGKTFSVYKTQNKG